MSDKTVIEFLLDAALTHPEKIAYIDENNAVKFFELRNHCFHIASCLLSYRQQPVAVFMDKSVDKIEAFFGVACSGNFYVPLDTDAPVERNRKIINLLQCPVIITDEINNRQSGKLADEIKAKVMVWSGRASHRSAKNDKIVLDRIKEITSDDLLYVIFTSGSTGVPKGVEISHGAVVSYMEWTRDAFGLDDTIILGNQTPFYFSMSVFDIYITLRNCGTMHIIPKPLFSFPARLLQYIRDRQINIIYWVPTALCMVANFKVLGKVDISCIKKVLFAGEVMPAKQLNMWRRQLPQAMFVNMFGPTEVTDICNYYILSRDIADDEPVPMGNVCPGLFMEIVDDNGVKASEGELYIGGETLAGGYYKDEEKTKEAFIRDPLVTSHNETMYKTGDIVRYNEYGELVYVSRKDNQIKRLGNRIELGEIEAAAASTNGVDLAASVYDDAKLKIILFYTGSASGEELKKGLADKIPEYMRPEQFIYLKAMPLNANGKIDRKRLKAVYENNSAALSRGMEWKPETKL